MLRTLFVAILIVIGSAYAVRGPFYALLFYLWIAYFRPDAWLWSNWVTSLNLSLLVGAVVVLSTLFAREKNRLGLTAGLIVLFCLHGAVSVGLSDSTANLWPAWQIFARVALISLVIIRLVTSEARLRLVLLVIAASLALEGAKQGWAQLLLNPGAVNTNPSPFLGDNNGVAVGMLMLVPILTALAATSTRFAFRLGTRFVIVGVIYRAISTYSRGGFLAAIALGATYLARARRKTAAIVGIAVLAFLIVPILPDQFWARMGTITTAATADDGTELDSSAAGRLHFWQVAVEMARENPYGGIGFNAYNAEYDRYDFSNGQYGKGRSVHSAWFGLLAETGFAGLGLFLALFVKALTATQRVRRLARTAPSLERLAAYALALQSSLLVFAVGGSFVPYQYNEMVWHLLALCFVLDLVARETTSLGTGIPNLSPEPTTTLPRQAR